MPAYADEGTPPPPGADAAGWRTAALERVYSREQTWLSVQADNLSRANNATGRMADVIEKLKSNGKVVKDLEKALSVFEEQLGDVQSSHDKAAAVLAAHNGFDPDGKVTDAREALETVKDAGNALRDAHRALRQAVLDLRQAVREWRQEHGPLSQPAESLAPSS
jgi:prefoldin subunit 5